MHAALRGACAAPSAKPARRSASYTAARSSRPTRPKSSRVTTSTGRWSAGRASKPRISFRSSPPRLRLKAAHHRLDRRDPFPESLRHVRLPADRSNPSSPCRWSESILTQRSEGGGLGVGGSSSGFMTARERGRLPHPLDRVPRRHVHRPFDRHGGDRRGHSSAGQDRHFAGEQGHPKRAGRGSSRSRRNSSPRTRPPRRFRWRSKRHSPKLFYRPALAQAGRSPVSLDSHGAVHFRYRRRGLIARQRLALGFPRGAAAGARLQGPNPQVRPLSERRSGDDVALSARRSLRHRRRGRDRPRPRPLRALHWRFGETVGQCDDRPDLPRHHRQGAARRLSRRDRPGDPARHQRDQGIRAGR